MRRAVPLLALVTIPAGIACSSDHDFLAKKPTTPEEGGTWTPTGSGGSGGGSNDAGTGGRGDTGTPSDGPWSLTWVNGVADALGARLCFVPVIDGGEAPREVAPWPDTAGGLAFAGHVVRSDRLGIDLAATDVHPYLVLEQGEGRAATCAEILTASDAGTSRPAAVSLPMLPAGTLAAQRSYLLVSTGCAAFGISEDAGAPTGAAELDTDGGGASRDAGIDAEAAPPPPPSAPDPAVCGGDGKTPAPTASLVLVAVSRDRVDNQVGLQALHASPATPAVSVRITPTDAPAPVVVAAQLATGQLAPPRPGFHSLYEFGTTPGLATLTVEPSITGSVPNFETTLAAVLSSSHVADADFRGATRNFTLVLVGAAPGLRDAGSAQPFAAVLVDNAPPPQ
jgi:hypothetical protein